MADTKFDICSRALVRVGCNPITSFEDGTAESIVAAREYEPRVQAELSAHRWRFATKQFELNLLQTAPLGRWSNFYQLPGDVLAIHGIVAGGALIRYDRYEDRIACDASAPVVADYTYRAPETKWPAYFTDALVTRLASIFARAIPRNSQLADELETRADRRDFPRARLIDSQQQTNRQFARSRLTAVRS